MQMPALECQQLRASHAGRGQQLEHRPVRGMNQRDDELHRLDELTVPVYDPRERPRLFLIAECHSISGSAPSTSASMSWRL
jgi:hypothetical protein